MEFVDTIGLKRLGYLYAPPLGKQEEELGFYGKNRSYLDKLIAEGSSLPSVRQEVFDELERLAGFFPSIPPEGSFANNFVCRAAIGLATAWDVPVLTKMLFWPVVIDHRDNSYLSILLEGIKEKGHAEDVADLEALHLELGNPGRLYYREGGNGPLIKMPGMVLLRERVKEIISVCLLRGSRVSEATRIENGSAAGSLQDRRFL